MLFTIHAFFPCSRFAGLCYENFTAIGRQFLIFPAALIAGGILPVLPDEDRIITIGQIAMKAPARGTMHLVRGN
jgi:hypothetical protein